MTWEDFCKHNKIGKRFHEASVLHFGKHETKYNTFDFSLEWLENPYSLILHGSTGTGKTYFSLSLIRALIEKNAEIRWMQATEFEDKLIAAKREFGCTKALIEVFSECEFLFIDDFGTETTNEGLEREWYKLINDRWSNAKQTVFTTNLNSDEVLKKYGSRIFSRFKDFDWIEFTGPDLRGRR